MSVQHRHAGNIYQRTSVSNLPVVVSRGRVSRYKVKVAEAKDNNANSSEIGSMILKIIYDDDGNMLANGNWSYTWSGENRLIRAENTTTGIRLEFAYDYRGRRIFKKIYENNSLTQHSKFIYDGYKLIEELDALNNDALVRRYAWQPETLNRDVPLTVYDAAADKTYFYHTDANKNVTELSNENGEVIAHYEYSPFGAYAASNPFRFSSEYFDQETGLVYYNYRYYNPELGRWISRDPIEEQGGYNLYGMIGNNPMNGWDKWGQGAC